MAESTANYDKRVKSAIQAAGLRVKKLQRRETASGIRRYKVKDPETGTKFKVTVKTCE